VPLFGCAFVVPDTESAQPVHSLLVGIADVYSDLMFDDGQRLSAVASTTVST
jgi:hypothetical protein